jgi:methylenetetrahydrofolate dehydrogenase (NADP+)/methenyltetrahydrofolate cyclohydrolase
LPLPIHINPYEIIHAIKQEKDVDCLHLGNQAQMLLWGKPNDMIPCTPAACLAILDEYKINLQGKRTTIIGRSNLVGFPIALLLLKRNATVTICHRYTADLQKEVEKVNSGN